MRQLFLIFTLLLPLVGFSQVYKCVENGKMVYSQQPCSMNSTQSEVLINMGQNPATFDIAGIKLGMTEAQAIKTIISNLGITRDDIKFTNDLSKLNQYQQQQEKLVSLRRQSYTVHHETGNYIFSVWKDANNPQQKIVLGVIFSKKVADKAEMNKFKNNIIKKYGKPTTAEYNNNFLRWCDPSEVENKSCPVFPKKASYELKTHDSDNSIVQMLMDGRAFQILSDEAAELEKQMPKK